VTLGTCWYTFTGHFSGPASAVGPVCVCLSLSEYLDNEPNDPDIRHDDST